VRGKLSRISALSSVLLLCFCGSLYSQPVGDMTTPELLDELLTIIVEQQTELERLDSISIMQWSRLQSLRSELTKAQGSLQTAETALTALDRSLRSLSVAMDRWRLIAIAAAVVAVVAIVF
jgi:chromosome segregation ATPase